EAWRFTELAHELRLTRNSSLRYLERYRLNPDERDPEHPWMAGAANYLASALIYDARATADAAEAFQRRVDAVPDVSAGIGAIEPGLIVARLTAASGPPFARAQAAVRDLALDVIFDSPDLVLRK